MKARLLQTLFTAQVIFCSTFILAAESNKDIRALQEQNIMSVLFQQTSAEGWLLVFKHTKQLNKF